jgi:hypothetical protein
MTAPVPDPRLRDRDQLTVEVVARIIYDGVLAQWLPGTVRDALEANFDPRPIAAEVEARVQAAAGQRAAEEIRPFEELFACDPDTSCRTTWRREPGWSLPGSTAALTECVEVPMDDLRVAFDRAAALASPAPAPRAAHSEAGR